MRWQIIAAIGPMYSAISCWQRRTKPGSSEDCDGGGVVEAEECAGFAGFGGVGGAPVCGVWLGGFGGGAEKELCGLTGSASCALGFQGSVFCEESWGI